LEKVGVGSRKFWKVGVGNFGKVGVEHFTSDSATLDSTLLNCSRKIFMVDIDIHGQDGQEKLSDVRREIVIERRDEKLS